MPKEVDGGTPQTPIFRAVDIRKSFGGTVALHNAQLELRAGEVHALLGENGAGKSTLIKIMTGLHRADSGRLFVDGTPIEVSSPAEAQRHGIVAIYQEPLIFPDLSVAENIFMAHRDRGRIVNRRSQERDAAEVLKHLDVDIDPARQAATLTVGEQQAVEIAKAMTQQVRVLIMDEPTAALSAHEVRRLFRQVEQLRSDGVAVLFISHRLDEVFKIADRITVFRDGGFISSNPVGETNEAQVVKEMVGRELGDFFVRTPSRRGDQALAVTDLGRIGVFRGVTFDVHYGEVLGLAGLVGAGRTDIALALFGIAPADSGLIERDGKPVSIGSPQEAMSHGIAYVSEDRRKLGLSMPQSLVRNLTLPELASYTSKTHIVDTGAERAAAERYRQALSIKTPSIDAAVDHLSGGNQQKVMLAKWLNTEPKVLILDEPTRGIDVGAKADVHQLVDDLAHQGMAVIMISSDLPEVLAMSDRIVVMREGHQINILDRTEFTQERVMAAAVGSER